MHIYNILFPCLVFIILYLRKLIVIFKKESKDPDTPISSADFELDINELEGLFNTKTKMIILNTPHNPLGKVFRREELEKIAALCRKWNVLCLSDEVYEWIVFDEREHIRICTLPGMWERTLTIGSAGKTFSVTGWKIGWVYGPANLMRPLQLIHQNCVYTCPTPLQEAIARSFEIEIDRFNSPDCYFRSLARELTEKRDFMANFLREAGMTPIIPEGSYFMLANWTKLGNIVLIPNISLNKLNFNKSPLLKELFTI